jgi:hypothetical protein
MQVALLFFTGIGSTWIWGQDSRTPTSPWLLESYRPVVGVQFCETPSIAPPDAFDGDVEVCKAEFDRLFIKCTTELPNVSLPAEFRDREEQGAAITLLYDCISAYYFGGAALEKFERRYPVEEPAGAAASGD